MIFRRRGNRADVQLEGAWAEEFAPEIFTYEMLLLREMEQDAMLWQTPTIALTAQAFLLTIALNPASPGFATVLSAGLGILVALLSVQLMAKHRFLNLLDRAYLHYLEDRLGISHISHRNYFFRRGEYVVPPHLASRREPKRQTLLTKAPSYEVWLSGMACFAAVNFAILIVQFVWPHLIHPAS